MLTREARYETRQLAPFVNDNRTPLPIAAGGDNASQAWRGDMALALADRILRQTAAAGVTREDVAPELEPIDPDVNDDDPSRDMEPMDPTIDASLGCCGSGGRAAMLSRATVTGDEHEVTITADEGEILDASEMAGGDVVVHVDEEPPPEEAAFAAPVAKSVTIVIDLDVDEHDNIGDDNVDAAQPYTDSGDDHSDDHSTTTDAHA